MGHRPCGQRSIDRKPERDWAVHLEIVNFWLQKGRLNGEQNLPRRETVRRVNGMSWALAAGVSLRQSYGTTSSAALQCAAF